MAIANVTLAVNLAPISSNVYLNMASTSGISPTGYWFYYTPVNSNNDTLGANITPYSWGTALPLVNSATRMQIQGTIAMIWEPWEGANVRYHGSCIEWIGPGTNDITNTLENDAFFFGHLGSLSPATDDDAFYWDRAYEGTTGSDWDFYQYHLHLPAFYPRYENGRQTHSARGWINEADKAYGYMINTRVTVMSVDYASILARIHTPSIGGAHNSHNDVTLPTVSTKNYMPGGILKGLSNRFHAFYIAANGSLWDVFIRTYTQASLSFGNEFTIGTFDLADPNFTVATLTGVQNNYPVRASAGTSYGERIYFPVLFANVSVATNFDLKVWSLISADATAGGSLIQYTLVSNVTVRPDCHLKVFGSNLYAVHSNVTSGGVTLQSFNGTTWTNEGQVVTNSNTKYVRVHGFEHNPADNKFYTLLSGSAFGGNTYTGQGLYSFELTGQFPGYSHLDYDYANNAIISRGANSAGYLSYDQVSTSINRYNTVEPAGIPDNTNVLNYTVVSPKFSNKHESVLGGDEYYYQGIQLSDGRRFTVGRIVENEDNLGTGTRGDLLVTVWPDTNEDPHHIAWGGAGDDYITGCWEDRGNSRVWLTGYTKSELVDRKDMRIHGFCRNFSDATSQLQFVDVDTDSGGNIYVVANHSSNYVLLFKFDANYRLTWQTSLDAGGNVDVAYGISVAPNDNHVYVCGSTTNTGQGGKDAFLAKAMTDFGDLDFVTVYGTGADNYATSVDVVMKAGTERAVMSIVTGTTTTITVVDDLDGSIYEQNTLSDIVVQRIRADSGNANVGRFLFAGRDTATITSGKFGYGIIDDPTTMIKWLNTYSDGSGNCCINDLRAIDSDEYVFVGNISTKGLVLKVQDTGSYTITKSWAKTVADTSFNGTTIAANAIHVVGYTTASGITEMGMNDAIIAQFTTSGNIVWQNAFGHDMDERFNAVVTDVTGENIISAGWSESHSFGRDAILFRSWTGGYGTGKYHLEENSGQGYFYAKSNLTVATENSSISSVTPPADNNGNLVTAGGTFQTFTANTYTIYNQGTNNYLFSGGEFASNTADPTLTLTRGGTYTFLNMTANHPFWIKTEFATGNLYAYNDGVTNNGANVNVGGGIITFAVPENAPDHLVYACGSHSGMRGNINIVNNPYLFNGFVQQDYAFTPTIYDGSFGVNGVFLFWLGYFDLKELQEYLNSPTHKQNTLLGKKVDYTSAPFRFWQAGTVGDGTADDGNMFGYDIIVHSNGKVYAIGQTSGDLSKTNLGASGVYDYVLVEFDPVTETMEFYQNGTELDEETYALTELADGNIAYVGRTSGNLGSANQGGYDIFLGIFNPNSGTSSYYSTGSGLDDKGVNVHDIGGNVLAIAYSSYGAVGTGTTNVGTEDIGVILFNYVTDTWGNAYQTGSTTSEVFEQNGKPSFLTPDKRLAICCSSAGNFADDAIAYGLLDLCVGILDLSTGTWQKFQAGSGASDFASSIYGTGDKLMITGYSRATFADGISNGVWLDLDILRGIGAKSAAQ